VTILVVDCGGTGLKAALFDAGGQQLSERLRIETPYPLSPTKLADTIAALGNELQQNVQNNWSVEQQPQAATVETTIIPAVSIYSATPTIERITVGMPGMIRHGKVVYTPHYITTSGPHSAVDSNLAAAWQNCDFQSLLTARLGVPTRVLNDAELHGFGVVSGQGMELVLTLGTGLGSAWYDDGVLAPHLEISHAPVRIGEMVLGLGRRTSLTFDRYIGDKELHKLGADHWSDRVLAMVDALRPVFQWDRLYLGGGNAQCIAPWAIARLGEEVAIVPNDAALTGGVRIWN
jgi:polyphosphate glucokinase